jgi:5-methylcytosine-specific restriction protein A
MMISADYAARLVADRLGIPCEARLANGAVEIAPTGVDANEGFAVRFEKGWRSAEANFVPGKFAKPLIRKMGEAPRQSRQIFSALIERLSPSVRLKFVANGFECSASAIDAWPPGWTSLTLSLTRGALPADTMQERDWQTVADDLILPLFALSASLIGIEDCDSDPSATEGTPRQQLSTKYERKPINREICLRLNGRRCVCCGMSFADIYGELASDYIEVHHIEPISAAGEPYHLNPATDLVPVCSNCHSVIHRFDPPMKPDALRAQIELIRKAKCDPQR